MKAREAFRKEILRILKATLMEIEEKRTFKVVVFPEIGGLSFPNSIASNYARARRILLERAENAGKIVSMKEMEARLDKFLVGLAGMERRDLTNIDQHVRRLFREVKAIPSERYLFLVPVDHIDCKCDLTIGDSILMKLDENAFEEIERSHGVRLVFPGESGGEHARKLIDWNTTTTFVQVEVQASDAEKARQLAFQRADHVLSVLRLFIRDAPCVIHGDGRQDVEISTSSVDIERGTVSRSAWRPNRVAAPLKVDEQLVRQMNERGLRKIHAVFSKKGELTDLEQRLLGSIFWNGNAVKETSPTDKLVKYVTALEVLLLTGERSKKVPLARRFASIVYAGASFKVKVEVFAWMCRLYDLRSQILHAGFTYVEKDILVQASSWTQSAVAALLKHVDHESLSSLLRDVYREDTRLSLRGMQLE